MSTITVEPTCPKCGAHLANWLEVFGTPHTCQPALPRNIWLTNNILSSQHRDAGLTLEEEEDFIHLKRNGTRLAVFTRHAMTREIINEADQAVEWAKSGIEFRELAHENII